MFDKKALFTRVEKRNKVAYVVNGQNILLILTTASLLLLFSNIFYMCSCMFSCRKIIPTISYTGCFLSLDRTFIFGVVLYLPVLLVTYIATYMRIRESSELAVKIVVFLLSVAGLILLMLIPLVDDLNGLHFLILDDVHIFISLSFFVLNLAWGHIILDELGKLDLPYNDAQTLRRVN